MSGGVRVVEENLAVRVLEDPILLRVPFGELYERDHPANIFSYIEMLAQEQARFAPGALTKVDVPFVESAENSAVHAGDVIRFKSMIKNDVSFDAYYTNYGETVRTAIVIDKRPEPKMRTARVYGHTGDVTIHHLHRDHTNMKEPKLNALLAEYILEHYEYLYHQKT